MSAATSPLRAPLMTGATTGSSVWVEVSAYTLLTFYVKTNGTPGAGTLLLEEADLAPTTEDTDLTASQIVSIAIVGDVGNSAQYAYHVGGPGGSFAYSHVRARLSADVTDTTIDVVLRAT